MSFIFLFKLFPVTFHSLVGTSSTSHLSFSGFSFQGEDGGGDTVQQTFFPPLFE